MPQTPGAELYCLRLNFNIQIIEIGLFSQLPSNHYTFLFNSGFLPKTPHISERLLNTHLVS